VRSVETLVLLLQTSFAQPRYHIKLLAVRGNESQLHAHNFRLLKSDRIACGEVGVDQIIWYHTKLNRVRN